MLLCGGLQTLPKRGNIDVAPSPRPEHPAGLIGVEQGMANQGPERQRGQAHGARASGRHMKRRSVHVHHRGIQSVHHVQLIDALESSERGPELHDARRQHRPDACQRHQLLRARFVQAQGTCLATPRVPRLCMSRLFAALGVLGDVHAPFERSRRRRLRLQPAHQVQRRCLGKVGQRTFPCRLPPQVTQQSGAHQHTCPTPFTELGMSHPKKRGVSVSRSA